MMTTWEVGAEINGNPTWRHAVERACAWVNETLGRWYADKHFSWRVLDSKREPSFDLIIQSDGCTVADRFDLFELANEKLFKTRLVKLWGDLTQQTIHALAESLKQTAIEWQKEAPVAAAD
jgi:hypothetical protein